MGALTLDVGGRRFDGAANGNAWIARDGLDGWWDSAETLYEDETSDGVDGAFDPVTVSVGPKRVNVALVVESSSPEWADTDVRDWAASLAKMTDLEFRVFHAGRWRWLRRAKVRGSVRVIPNRRDLRLTEIQFTAWSADPRRYGTVRDVPITAEIGVTGGLEYPIVDDVLDFGAVSSVTFPGGFNIINEGTAPFLPESFTIAGGMDSFTITSDAHVIEYDAPIEVGQTLILSPYAGGRAVLDGADVSQNLTQADWAYVPAEGQRGYLFSPVNPTPGAQLTVTHANGAWW
jgi:hypothetical protein